MSLQAKKYLQKSDPVLAKIIAQVNLPQRKRSRNHFRALVESIISQQLSVKASDTIFKRFVKLFPGGRFPKAEAILKIPDRKFRSVGISGAKTKFIKDLALHVHQGKLNFQKIRKLSDEEVIDVLIKVKGIGRWTAEMFLMFSFDRPDLFSHGDLGLRNAIQRWYKFRKPPTAKQIDKIVTKWSPHRTLACRYLWHSLSLK